MRFFLGLLLLPVIEIAVFLMVADEIGFFTALGLCILSGVIGFTLVQTRGIQTWAAVQDALRQGVMPVEGLFEAICLFAAGILFMVPGFFTDFLAILLLVPPIRNWVRGALEKHFDGTPVHFYTARSRTQSTQADIIDAEFTRVDPDKPEDPKLLP